MSIVKSLAPEPGVYMCRLQSLDGAVMFANGANAMLHFISKQGYKIVIRDEIEICTEKDAGSEVVHHSVRFRIHKPEMLKEETHAT